MKDFVEIVKKNYQDTDLILKAFDFACEAHKNEKRKTGEPYIIHPIAVAKTLIDLGLDKETISAALLHDVVEDTPVSYKILRKEFGEEVEMLVKGVSKISGIKYDKPELKEMNSLRRLFISMSKDIRVILIKLADRLHNIKTVDALSPERQIRFCSETMSVFVPIAERLGLNAMKNEMENKCFSILRPNEYKKLKDEFDRKFDKTQERLQRVELRLKEILSDSGIKCEVKSRLKHFYSLYKKIRDKGTAKIYDIIAFRILVENEEDCYKILGVVHKAYKPVPGRIKDYIAAPKANGYKSLHTTLLMKDGTPFEVQIRTYKMHEYCEYGIASHWRYKQQDEKADILEDKLSWIRSVIEDEKQIKDSENFIKALQMDFSTSEICVFTPKYKPISLPEKSTPIDFAYAIHSDLGNTCVGAKVNEKKVSLSQRLETGDVVEIITSKNGKGPSREWLKIAVSTHARNHIKNYFKKSIIPQNVTKGRELLEQKAIEFNVPIAKCLSQEVLEEVRKKYLVSSLEDMFSSIAMGGIKPVEIIMLSMDDKKPQKEDKKDCPVYIDGRDTDGVKFARCCSPIPGDEICAVASNSGITVHCESCSNLKNVDKERRLSAQWKENINKLFDVSLKVVGRDKIGTFSKIIDVFYNNNFIMSYASAKVVSEGKFESLVTAKIKNKEEEGKIISLIKAIDNVQDVTRNNLN